MLPFAATGDRVRRSAFGPATGRDRLALQRAQLARRMRMGTPGLYDELTNWTFGQQRQSWVLLAK
jgi:hypothetical protein